MTDVKDKILAAIDQCFAASQAPPTSGDLAAAVLRAVIPEIQICAGPVAHLNLYGYGLRDRERNIVMMLGIAADELDGALLNDDASLLVPAAPTDPQLEVLFRAWWAESYPTPPGPHALMTHIGWARHLLNQAGHQGQQLEAQP